MPTLFSVIIPHHNIPDLLRRCLDSIPLRDDLEVIVVDDHSDPAIVDFDNFPGRERPDVTILHNTGRYAGTARNTGIEAAKGRWLIFADADDFFTYGFRSMLDKYADSDADIVYLFASSLDGETYYHNSKTARRERHIRKYFKMHLDGNPMGEVLLRYAWGEPWSKMFRREMVVAHGIRFDATPIHNDTLFAYTAGHHARKIAVDAHCAYYVTYRAGSLSLTVSEDKLLARVGVFARKERFMRDNTPYAFLDKVDCSHYEAWTELVWGGKEARKQAKETLKTYGLTGPRAYAWFAFFTAKIFVKKCLGRK